MSTNDSRFRLPLWFRMTVAAMFAAVFLVYFLVHDGGVQRAIASSLLDRAIRAQAPLEHLSPGSFRGMAEPPNGTYWVNGMKVQYATFPAPVGLGEAMRRFRTAFEEAGYVSRAIDVRGKPALVAVHPETKMMLSVRPGRDGSGKQTVRLSQQDLSRLDPSFQAEIPGVPVLPGGTNRVLVRAEEKGSATSLNYTVDVSPEWVAEFYAQEMSTRGWARNLPPVEAPATRFSTLFFEKKNEECAVVVFPRPDQGGSIVFVTRTVRG